MKTANDYMEWFWTEWIKIKNTTANDEDGLCSCEFDIFINESSSPDQMRAFLLIGTFIDQMMYTHFKDIYYKFRLQYKYPKIYSHAGPGMENPRVFFFPLCGAAAAAARAVVRDTKGKLIMRTIVPKERDIKPVAMGLFSGLYDWFSSLSDSNEKMYIRQFNNLLIKEIYAEFGEIEGEVLLKWIHDFI